MSRLQALRRNLDRTLAGHANHDLDVYIHEEKDTIKHLDLYGHEQREAGRFFAKWGQAEEDADLRDITDKAGSLMQKMADCIQLFSKAQEAYRAKLKLIRAKEEAAQPLRDRFKRAEAALVKLEHKDQSGRTPVAENKLDEAKREVAAAESALISAEIDLAEYKRQILKETLHLRFDSMRHLGAQLDVLGVYGKYIADQVPVGVAPTADHHRPPYRGADITIQIVKDAMDAMTKIDLPESIEAIVSGKPLSSKPTASSASTDSTACNRLSVLSTTSPPSSASVAPSSPPPRIASAAAGRPLPVVPPGKPLPGGPYAQSVLPESAYEDDDPLASQTYALSLDSTASGHSSSPATTLGPSSLYMRRPSVQSQHDTSSPSSPNSTGGRRSSTGSGQQGLFPSRPYDPSGLPPSPQYNPLTGGHSPSFPATGMSPKHSPYAGPIMSAMENAYSAAYSQAAISSMPVPGASGLGGAGNRSSFGLDSAVPIPMPMPMAIPSVNPSGRPSSYLGPAASSVSPPTSGLYTAAATTPASGSNATSYLAAYGLLSHQEQHHAIHASVAPAAAAYGYPQPQPSRSQATRPELPGGFPAEATSSSSLTSAFPPGTSAADQLYGR